MLGDDHGLYHALCAVLTALVGGILVALLYRRLRTSRPDLRLGTCLFVGFALRAGVALVLELAPSTGRRLRGPDDFAFLDATRTMSHHGVLSGSWMHTAFSDPHIALLTVQDQLLGGPGAFSFRLTHVAVAMAGILLVAVAAYDLAGARAALVAGWIAALEPSSVFFSSFLGKESLSLLGEGILAIGAVRLWRRPDRPAMVILALGTAVVFAGRSYAGIFVGMAVAVLGLRVIARRLPRAWRWATVALPVVLVVGAGGAVAAGALPQGTLARLQGFQDSGGGRGGPANLQLEPVDFTTPGGLATGVPQRIRDFLLRPYPWQQQNVSQRVGAVATLYGWALGLTLIIGFGAAPRDRRRLSPPFAYPAFAITIAYAVTTANAGTGLRHRMHLLVLLAGLAAVLLGDRARLPARVQAALVASGTRLRFGRADARR